MKADRIEYMATFEINMRDIEDMTPLELAYELENDFQVSANWLESGDLLILTIWSPERDNVAYALSEASPTGELPAIMRVVLPHP